MTKPLIVLLVCPSQDGMTALQVAMHSEKAACAAELLSAGADPHEGADAVRSSAFCVFLSKVLPGSCGPPERRRTVVVRFLNATTRISSQETFGILSAHLLKLIVPPPPVVVARLSSTAAGGGRASAAAAPPEESVK